MLKRPNLAAVVHPFGLEMRCLRLRTRRLTARQSMAFQSACPSGSIAGVCIYRLLGLRSFHRVSRGSPIPRQPPFGVGICRIQQVMEQQCCWFPLPFGDWPSLLGMSCSRWGSRRSLRSAYLGEDLNGVFTFRIGEVRPGRALPILRGLGVHEHGGNEPCPLSHPPLSSIDGGSSITKPQ